MLGALYWKQANRRVFAGLAAGIFLWFYTLVLPIAAHSVGWPLQVFQAGLAARQPAEPADQSPTQGVVLSLAGNFTLFAWVSLLSRTRVSEHWQAGRFIGQQTSARPSSKPLLAVQIDDLLTLASRFVGEERARQSFIRFAYRQGKGFNPNQNADGDWIEHRTLLAGVLGTRRPARCQGGHRRPRHAAGRRSAHRR